MNSGAVAAQDHTSKQEIYIRTYRRLGNQIMCEVPSRSVTVKSTALVKLVCACSVNTVAKALRNKVTFHRK